MKHSAVQFAVPSELRSAIRRGEFTGPTAGHVPGYVQANLVIIPAVDAADFAEFCRKNSRACPLIAQTAPGDPVPQGVAEGADLRTDVPRYCVFRHGRQQPDEPADILHLWRDDLVAFLLGCSFTFERALQHAGLAVRHIDEGRNVPMFRTSIDCVSAGRFAGPLVVSMRPYLPDEIPHVQRITAAFPRMHGEPIHVGDPEAIGIVDLSRPDFGEAVTIKPGEVPVFWACGVTPQLALESARCELAITHSPGRMFVTDLREDAFDASHG